jgi:hypothetical protein
MKPLVPKSAPRHADVDRLHRAVTGENAGGRSPKAPPGMPDMPPVETVRGFVKWLVTAMDDVER